MWNELSLDVWCDNCEYRQIYLSGKKEDLQQLVDCIGKGEGISCSLNPRQAASMKDANRMYLRYLEVEVTTGPAMISIENDTIVFSGAHKNLEIMSKNISAIYKSLTIFDNKHTHIEHVPGLDYIAPESLALVVYLRV